MNLAVDLRRWSTANARGRALAFEGSEWTYGDVQRAVSCYADRLARSGVGRGALVGIRLGSSPEFFAAVYGAWTLGAAAVPLNIVGTQRELAYALDVAEPAVVVGDHTLERESVEVPTAVVGAELPTFREAVVTGGCGSVTAVDPETPALVAFTSGTEGAAKAACLSHWNIRLRLDVVRDHLGLDSRSPTLQMLPVSSSGPSLIGVFFAWHLGSMAVLLPRFRPEAFLDAVERYRPAFLSAVPTMLHDILAVGDHDQLRSVRYMLYGASSTPAGLRERFEDHFGIRLRQAYGQTEAPSIVAMDPLHAPPRAGTVGIALPHVDIRVEHPDHTPCCVGERGAITVQARQEGPYRGQWAPFLGYLGNPRATARAVSHGALHTGDVGFVDDEGYVHFVGRSSEMIISGGNNISAVELEQLLSAQRGVREAAVVAAPDERLVEIPMAFVVLDDDRVDVASIVTKVNQSVAPYKVIRKFAVLAPGSVPRNAMGKIQKSRLTPTTTRPAVVVGDPDDAERTMR